MKVYLVYEIVIYEEPTLLGAFSSKERAKIAEDAIKEQIDDIHLEIFDVEVDPNIIDYSTGVSSIKIELAEIPYQCLECDWEGPEDDLKIHPNPDQGYPPVEGEVCPKCGSMGVEPKY